MIYLVGRLESVELVQELEHRPLHLCEQNKEDGVASDGRTYMWLYLDAEVLILPPILFSGLCFCWLPIFVDNQLLHPSASPRARLTSSTIRAAGSRYVRG